MTTATIPPSVPVVPSALDPERAARARLHEATALRRRGRPDAALELTAGDSRRKSLARPLLGELCTLRAWCWLDLGELAKARSAAGHACGYGAAQAAVPVFHAAAALVRERRAARAQWAAEQQPIGRARR